MVQRSAKKTRFTIFALYQIVRHPIYLGLITILWFTPLMSLKHLSLSVLFTAYIFVGIYYEEKDLIQEFGNIYEEYRKNVSSVIPFTKLGSGTERLKKELTTSEMQYLKNTSHRISLGDNGGFG